MSLMRSGVQGSSNAGPAETIHDAHVSVDWLGMRRSCLISLVVRRRSIHWSGYQVFIAQVRKHHTYLSRANCLKTEHWCFPHCLVLGVQ